LNYSYIALKSKIIKEQLKQEHKFGFKFVLKKSGMSMFSILCLFALVTGVLSNHPLWKLEDDYENTTSVFEVIKDCSSMVGKRPLYCGGCHNMANWLMFMPEGPCLTYNNCKETDMVTKNCVGCQRKDINCPFFDSSVWPDDIVCQNNSLRTNEEALKLIESPYCKVGDMVLRKCENSRRQIEEVYFILVDDTVHFVNSMKLFRDQMANDFSSYECEGDCSDECKKGFCDGDDTFCGVFGCTKTIDCICQVLPNTGLMYTVINEIKIDMKCWGTTRQEVEIEIHDHVNKRSIDCESCTMVCTDTGVLVETHGPKINFYKVCKNPSCISSDSDDSVVDIIFSKQMMSNPGKVQIELWIDDSRSKVEYTLFCRSQTVCSLIQCYMCYERWGNMSCYGVTEWILIIIFGMFSVITLAAVFFLLSKVKGFMMCISYPCWCLYRLLSKKLRKTKDKTVKYYKRYEAEANEVSDEEQRTQLIEVIEDKPRYVRAPTRGSSKRLFNFTALSIICCLSIMETNSCSEFTSFSVSAPSCIYSEDGTDTCSMTYSTRLSVSPIGQTSCLLVSDPTNKPLGSLTFQTNSVTLLCKKNSLYYIPSEVKVESESTHRCRHSGDCWNEHCENFSTNSSLENWTKSKSKLGWSKCSRSCGCAGCGCFLCAPSCLYYRVFYHNPSKGYAEVFDCPQWAFEVSLKVSTSLLNHTQTEQIKLIPGKRLNTMGFDISLVSVSIPPTPMLNKCFIKFSDGSIRMTECNRRGEYSVGKVGEIQCPTDIDARDLSTNCIGSQGLFVATPQDFSVIVETNTIDPFKVSVGVPLSTEGLSIYSEFGLLYADVKELGMFEMQLNFQNYKLIAKSDKNMCYAKFIEVVGCYSCLSGSTVTLEVNTNFGSAKGFINCPDSNVQFPFSAYKTSKRIDVNVKFERSKVYSKCSVICPAGETTVVIEGELNYIQNTDGRVSQGIVSTNRQAESGGFGFGDLLNLDWMGWIKGLLIIVVIGGFGVLIGLYFLMRFRLMLLKTS